MACSAVRYPLLRNSSVRNYATAAATAKKPNVAASPCVQVLDNKVTFASLDNGCPIARVSVIYRAGSRNECYNTQGLTHVLRLAAGLTTSRASAFGITRNIQQMGGVLTVTSDRESISYNLEITRDKVDTALPFLEDMVTRQLFRPWEVSDLSPRLRYELSCLPETTKLIELIHKAAYCDGLGYSLYSPKRQINKIGTETLQHFVSSWFVNSRCAVTATGTDASEVCDFAKSLKSSETDCTNAPAVYRGGQIRKDRDLPIANVSLGFEAAGMNKKKEAIAFAILKRAAGTGPHVKWGNSGGPLIKVATAAAGNQPVAISACNVCYTDSGLFGCVISAPAAVAGDVTKAALQWLRAPKLSEDDIQRGKVDLARSVMYVADNNSMLHEDIGCQALFTGKVETPEAQVAEISSITSSDVQHVANSLSKAKLSLAAIGDLSTVPFLQDL